MRPEVSVRVNSSRPQIAYQDIFGRVLIHDDEFDCVRSLFLVADTLSTGFHR